MVFGGNVISGLASLPFTDLTDFLCAGELTALDEYLMAQCLFDFGPRCAPWTGCVKEFDAGDVQKHADAIELHDLTDWGVHQTYNGSDQSGFHRDRANRGNPQYWQPNGNSLRLPELVAFVARLPFFDYTGKVTLIINRAMHGGTEHSDHHFDDLVSEFVWIKLGSSRKRFYVRDGLWPFGKVHEVSGADVLGGAVCGWFDDHYLHGIIPVDEDSMSIRVDGKFTNAFREHICLVGKFAAQTFSSTNGLKGVLASQRHDLHLQPLHAHATDGLDFEQLD